MLHEKFATSEPVAGWDKLCFAFCWPSLTSMEHTVAVLLTAMQPDLMLLCAAPDFDQDYDDEHWARKKRRYLGHSVFPPQSVIDWDCTQRPLQVRVMTWRGLQWAQFQQQLNEVCRLIMLGAQADDSIMPVNR